MSGKNSLKRSSETPAVDDRPNKKKSTDANNKLGRPRNVGDDQHNHIMSGLKDYLVEKRKKANKERHNVSKVFDGKTFDFIAKYGWNNPFRTLKEDVSDATAAARAAAKAEAEEAARVVAKGPGAMEAEKFAEQQRRDEVVAAVRGEITKLYQKAVREADPNATKTSLDIPKLIRSIMSKPTQRQLYLVWAKLRERPDLEREVDRRHAAAIEEKGSSSRGAVWNNVASEWYNACSEDEKVITRREALKLLDIEMKDWEDQAASEPSSAEEARAFMEGSEEFLRAMMQFFANRISGIAVMFLAGPEEVSLSEAVCETPGKPKVLYSQIAEEETTLRLMGGRILSQSRLINEPKWGLQLRDDDSAAQGGAGDTHMDEGSCIDPALRQPQQTTTDDTASIGVAPETQAGLHNAINADVNQECAQEAVSTIAESTAGPSEACMEQASTHPVVGAARREAAEAKARAARARALLAKLEVEALEAEAKAATLAKPTARATSGAETMHDVIMRSTSTELEQPAVTATPIPASTPAAVPTPTDAGVQSTGSASVVAFDPCASLTGLDEVEAEYAAAFEKASAALSSRKSWWDNTNNPAFFKAVPQKLKHGEADVAIGCELSLAYLALEQSGAVEQPLKLVSSSNGKACMPEYLATFGGTGRSWAARWHKRMFNGGDKRTRAALDYDVNATLPRQWASLQPQTRLDADGRIAVPAHASMTWPSGVSPGQDGVRALVATLLNWGSLMKDKRDEQTQWRYVAADVAQVLRVLAQQGGQFQSSAPQGRKKLPSVKARDPNKS